MTDATSRVRLAEIAARVEAAMGADRELDIDIGLATGIGPWGHTEVQSADGAWHRVNSAALKFTSSLDAAVRLVPEGFDWIVGHTNGALTVYAEVGGTGGDYTRFAATPALALVSAALRAKAAGEDA